MTEPAVKYEIETTDPASFLVRALNLPELSDKANWLTGRLKKLFPHFQESHVLGWLRSISGTNGTSNYRLVCTDHAVALSEYRAEKLAVQPIVIDHFVFIQEGADVAEGQALYDDMKRWAMSLGASEIQINADSDVPRKLIEERLGKTSSRQVFSVKVGK